MNAVSEALPAVETLVNKVNVTYRSILFERVIEIVLQDAHRNGMGGALFGLPPSHSDPTIGSTAPPIGGRFGQFQKDYSITDAMLANVVDFDSGHVLTRNLGDKKAEKQRRLAAILSLVNARKTGVFAVSRDDLMRACDENGAYDSANFASTMKEAEFQNAVVFQKDGNDYRVTRPGEGFVADAVRKAGTPSVTGTALPINGQQTLP